MPSIFLKDLKKQIGIALLLLVALLSCFHFYLATYHTLLIGFADIDVFLYTLMNYLRNGLLYLRGEPLALTYEAGKSVLKFPPLYVVPYFSWVSANGIDQSVYKTLFSFHVVRYLATFLLCGFFLGPRKNIVWWMLLVIIFSLCAPFYEALYGLTFDNLFLFLLALALVLIKFKQQFMPIALLSYAASAKIYPAVQLIPFLIAKNWRMALYCIIMMLLWLGVSISFIGINEHEFYFFRIFPILLKEDILCEVGNLSLAGQMCSHRGLLVALKAFLIFSTLAITYISTRQAEHGFEKNSLLYSFLVCLPLLVMQNVWGNYQIILLIPIAILVGYSFTQRRWLRYCCLLAALIAWIPLTVSDNYPAMDLFYYSWLGIEIPRFMIDYLKPYSALLLWLASGLLLLRKKNTANAA